MAYIGDEVKSYEADPSCWIARIEFLGDEFADFSFVIFLFIENIIDDFGDFIFELIGHVGMSDYETVKFV